MELVRQACKEAFADEFITRLPEVSVNGFIQRFLVDNITGLQNHGGGCRHKA